MELDAGLLSEFAKVTIYDEKQPSGVESTVFGTVVDYRGKSYVKIDGSDLLTPVTTTTYLKGGDRVTVLIKNHTAIVSGNVSSPSAGRTEVEEIGNKISEFEIVISDKVSTLELEAERARITELFAKNVTIEGTLTSQNATIVKLQTTNVEISNLLIANKAEIDDLKVKKLDADVAELQYATIENLATTNANIYNLNATYGVFVDLTTQKFNSINANIQNLQADKLDATSAEILYANIDFANIGVAAIEKIFSDTGLIKDLIVGDSTVTGELVGVTIKGDLIEGNTIVADKLVVLGDDGIYYKLNTTGNKVEATQTDKNSLNGSIITAKSITATKISVDDLVAFDATIGGFTINKHAIHTNTKTSASNTTRGIYLDNDGQFVVGDSNNFIKYFKDTDGQYKIAISASQLNFTISSGKNIDQAIEDVENQANTAYDQSIKTISVTYVRSESGVDVPTTGWQPTMPSSVGNTYLWTRTTTELQNGTKTNSYTVSRTPMDGEDAVVIHVDSVNGNIFKNSDVATTLVVTVIVGSTLITDYTTLKNIFGNDVKMVWFQKKYGQLNYEEISPSDPRLSDSGFMLNINAQDVFTKTTFQCGLDY